MIRTFFLAIAAVFLSLAIYLYFYLGVYKETKITVEKRGPLHLLYKDHLGPYHETVSTWAIVDSWAKKNKVDCSVSFGEYIDDPALVDQDRLRSRLGCVLKGPIKKDIPEDFHYEERAQKTYAIGRFSGSPAIGPFTAYPRVREFLEENRYKSPAAVIEIYYVFGEDVTTEYLFEIENPPAP